jgi:hypothetical protein
VAALNDPHIRGIEESCNANPPIAFGLFSGYSISTRRLPVHTTPREHPSYCNRHLAIFIAISGPEVCLQMQKSTKILHVNM